LTQVTDLAETRACLSASGVDTSGFAAPARTIMPTPKRATGFCEPATILPFFVRSAIAPLVTMPRSKGAPEAISRVMTAETPYLSVTLWPLARSKAGTSASSEGLTAFEATTTRSADRAGAASSAAAAATAKKSRFIVGAPGVVVREV
jgi:hypothetical protein